MKITYIHQHFTLPEEGGGGRPYEFARRMSLDGHTVTMICGGKEAQNFNIDGIEMKRLAIPYHNSMSTPERMWSFLRFMFKASYLAARTKSNVIFASSTPLTVAVPGIVGKFFQRVPLIFEVRDLWPSVPINLGYLNNPWAIRLARLLEKAAYRNSHSVVALSPGMKKGVLDVAPQKKVTVIPNACDFELFNKSSEERDAFRRAQGWRPSETVVVYAGGFGPTYQLEWAVRLAAALKEDAVKFILIGEGKDSEKLKSLALELGLKPDSILLGLKARPEVANFVAASDLVLSALKDDPCLEVNSLNKVFDGLAAGRPIVVNHEGWLKEAITRSGAGWQLDRSIEKAAEQLRAIAKDNLALASAGKKSSELGHSQFERDQLYQKLMDVLQEAVT